MEIVVSEHLCRTLPEKLDAYKDACIVADPATYNAFGNAHARALIEKLRARIYMLQPSPKPTKALAEKIAQHAGDAQRMIAIGSGTINDLVKYAAHTRSIPYCVIATAPSMNGYSSATSSLIADGHKQSFAATAPIAIYADSGVLAAAPARMLAAGTGDTLCRSTVEADWRLAHKLLGVAYDNAIMEPLRSLECELLKHTAKVRSRDKGAITLLWEALIAGGDAMRAHGSSMPASQGEHMVAHAMEAIYPDNPSLHGEQVAVTTCSMVRLQAQMLDMPLLADYAAWIGEHSHTPAVLEKALLDAGCPVHATDLGWDSARYAEIANAAWKTRNRYGFLALASEHGFTVR